MTNEIDEQEVEELAHIMHDGLIDALENAYGYPIGSFYSRWSEVEEDTKHDYRTEARAVLRAGYRRVEAQRAEDG